MLVPESSKCKSQRPGPSLEPLPSLVFFVPPTPASFPRYGYWYWYWYWYCGARGRVHPSLVRPSPAPTNPTLEYSLLLPFCPVTRHQIYSLQSGPVHSTSRSPRLWWLPELRFPHAIPHSGRLLPSAASIRAHAHSDTLHSLGLDSTLIQSLPSLSSTQSIHSSIHPSIHTRSPTSPSFNDREEIRIPTAVTTRARNKRARIDRSSLIVARIGYFTASKSNCFVSGRRGHCRTIRWFHRLFVDSRRIEPAAPSATAVQSSIESLIEHRSQSADRGSASSPQPQHPALLERCDSRWITPTAKHLTPRGGPRLGRRGGYQCSRRAEEE